MKSAVILAYIICLFEICSALNVNSCSNGERGVDSIQQEITVGRCKKPPCRLKKGTTVPVAFKFTSAFDSANLGNKVWATIVGIPFPFVGVDGTDACKKLYKADGETLAGCPLKKGESYVYKDQFEILEIYPRIKLEVHWGLQAPEGHAVCFEVPARITN